MLMRTEFGLRQEVTVPGTDDKYKAGREMERTLCCNAYLFFTTIAMEANMEVLFVIRRHCSPFWLKVINTRN